MKASEAGKLKVAELQKLLKERGLPSSGTKAELVQRLVEASEKESASDEPSKSSAPSAAPAKSNETEPPAPAKAEQPSTKAGDPEGKAAASDPATGSTSAAPAASQTNAHGSSKPVSLDMDENERRKARAAKFGLPSEELNNDKLKARAAKFGLPLASIQEDKIKARMERFQDANKSSASSTKNSAEEEAKRLKRAERFGQTVATGPEGDKLAAREKRFKSS